MFFPVMVVPSIFLAVPPTVLLETEGIEVWEFFLLRYRYEWVTDVHSTLIGSH